MISLHLQINILRILYFKSHIHEIRGMRISLTLRIAQSGAEIVAQDDQKGVNNWSIYYIAPNYWLYILPSAW